MKSILLTAKLLFSETLPSSEIVSLSKWSSLTILNEQEFDSSSIPDKEGQFFFDHVKDI